MHKPNKMVYKRPTDFIPRKPSRTNDYDIDALIEPPLEDFLSALPDEGKCKSEDGFENFLESLNTEPSSVGRWASSSSLDYYSGEDDEEVSAKKARQKVRFASVEVRKYKVCEEIKSSHSERTLRSLDWEHSDSELINVDQYEAGKDESSTTRVKRTKPRRLSPPQRREIINKAKEMSGLSVNPPLRISSPVRERPPVMEAPSDSD